MRPPTSTAITHFAKKHPYWSRTFATDVLRDTRRAARDYDHFQHMTGLSDADALAVWVSGRDTRQEVAA